MNSQHTFAKIINSLKCFLLAMDTWVINTLYSVSYIPLAISNNVFGTLKIIQFSLTPILLSHIKAIINIKNTKFRSNSMFQLAFTNKYLSKYTNHHTILEWIWTIIPLLIMVIILFVSLLLLYSAYGSGGIWITTYIIKIIGSQWFWTYETLNNLTNLHYIDFYTQALQYNTGILFSVLSNSLPHLSYAINTDNNSNLINPSTLSDSDFILQNSNTTLTTDIDNTIYTIQSGSTNTNDISKGLYNEFITTLREFSKSEEKLNFYEVIRTWSNEQNTITFDLPIPNYKNIIFDSNILKNTYLNAEKPMRLLDVDNRIYLSMKHPIDLYVTTNDVIHSYAVPSFGIKLDSLPGRINYGCTFILRPGIYYGQCSELCGLNHAYMPTSVVVLNKNKITNVQNLLEHVHLFQICQN